MFSNPLKSSGIIVVDNTLKSTFWVIVLIITNLAVIINNIKIFNFDIDANMIIFGAIFIFMLVNLIINIVKWNITYVSYNNGVITVYKNIVIKNKYEFCVKNLSSIILEESILDKMFKVCRMRIYTYGTNNYLNDMEIMISKEKCLKLRDKILLDFPEKLDYRLEEEKWDINIKLKNVILHSFFNIPFSQIIVIINVILIIFLSINNSSGIKEIILNLLDEIIAVFGIILPVLYNFIKSIITFWGLKVDRNGEFLHIKYGILFRKRYIIPISKISGIVLSETILSRIFNYVSVNLICSGVSDNKNELKIILPMIKIKKVNEFISRILYNKNFKISSEYDFQPLKTLYSFVFVNLIMNTILLPIFIYYSLPKTYSLILLMLSAILIYFMYYFKRIQIYDNYFIITTGVLIKKKVIIKYEDVKFFKIRKDPILSKYNINIIDVYITSGFKNRKQSLGYVNLDNAKYILERIFV